MKQFLKTKIIFIVFATIFSNFTQGVKYKNKIWNLLVCQSSYTNMDYYKKQTKDTNIRILLQALSLDSVTVYCIEDGKIEKTTLIKNTHSNRKPLEDFLNWAEGFPSEKKAYALLMRNFDWYYIDYYDKNITLDTFSKMLGKRKFDIMFLDTNGAQMLEVLDQLKENTNVLIAKQGWVEFNILPSLIQTLLESSKNNLIPDTKIIGKWIVENSKIAYYESKTNQLSSQQLTLSAVDTEHAGKLGDLLTLLVDEIKKVQDAIDLQVLGIKTITVTVGSDADLLQLAESTLKFLKQEATKTKNENFEKAINVCKDIKGLLSEMILANVTVNIDNKMHGLSITYHHSGIIATEDLGIDAIYKKLEVGKISNWLEFISLFNKSSLDSNKTKFFPENFKKSRLTDQKSSPK